VEHRDASDRLRSLGLPRASTATRARAFANLKRLGQPGRKPGIPTPPPPRTEGVSEVYVPKHLIATDAIPLLGSARTDFAPARTLVEKEFGDEAKIPPGENPRPPAKEHDTLRGKESL
jgi:hypothetical protein